MLYISQKLLHFNCLDQGSASNFKGGPDIFENSYQVSIKKSNIYTYYFQIFIFTYTQTKYEMEKTDIHSEKILYTKL